MKAIVWLLPLLFILHDMEEIILAIPRKSSEALKKQFIRVRFVPFGTFFNTESFSIAVCKQLLLLTFVSAFGYFTGHYELWLGFLAAGTVVAAVNMKLLHRCGEVFTDYVSSFFR
ncbi:HXXEE domain-containing protein [Hungatella hominis]|uniref:HXXEE domain-containing protein n=1 Tax=Hungatella hominis TaxID=2763050 RepID=A0ABR7HB93_9FIRM|nr:HXXEE domain-containing protein [Hungatella hominis]MBC5710438.1 HXXEE domain-containing protein [Hungatella hominis]